MTYVNTFFFTTAPDDSVRRVAEKLNESVAGIGKSGYDILSIQPHIGVVEGVSCTVGYTIVGRKEATKKSNQNDDLPIVVAV